MARTSFTWSSFLGEISPYAQGRFDEPDYHRSMNFCLNSFPIEAGAWARRPGTLFAATTRKGKPGTLRDFHFSQNAPYTMEFTDGHLRFFSGIDLALVAPASIVTNVSTANPAVITLASAPGWVTGDQIEINRDPNDISAAAYPVFNRQWRVTEITTTTYSLADPITALGLDGSLMSPTPLPLQAAKVLDFVTPYVNGSWTNNRVVQNQNAAFIFNGLYPPYEVTSTSNPSPGTFAGFTFAQPSPGFTDGPYLDIPIDGSTLTPSAISGAITLTASAITSINNGAGFVSTDVGRLIRLNSEPAMWNSTTNYAVGSIVKYANTYWNAVTAGAGQVPGAAVAGAATPQWFLDPTAALWTWGTIASVLNVSQVTVTLAPVDPAGVKAGGPLLYILPIVNWALGLYSFTTGWPTGGTYAGGRFYIFGGLPNRFDGSVVNDVNPLNFAPTDLYGNVLDDSGLDETAETDDTNTIFWMQGVHDNSVVIGTESGEFLLMASALGDPITPTSIQVHRMTKYKAANIEPRWTGMSLAFVQAYQRNVMEYISDAYSRKLTAINLSERARHLTSSKIEEIAYQYELNPVIWARCCNGTLIGCTYKRESPFGTQPPKFYGWHHHALGSGRLVESIQSGPSADGTLDSLSMITNDPVTNIRYVEVLSRNFDENDMLPDAYFVDAGMSPSAAVYDPTASTVTLYGMNYLNGETISVFAGGYDVGDFTVINGTVAIPIDTLGSLFTSEYLQSLNYLTPAQRDCGGSNNLGTFVSGGSAYTMNAEENYDPAHVTYIGTNPSAGSTQIAVDQSYPGVQYDAVRRNIMYMYTEHISTTTDTNNTAHYLWDGFAAVAPTAHIDQTAGFNSSLAVKSIDTETVAFNLSYNVANVVPSGIGGSDGTYRRATKDFFTTFAPTTTGGNGPGMTDPYTGNFWIGAASCELYCFRLSDNYSQTISPVFPVQNANNQLQPVGFTNNGATNPWMFAQELNSISTYGVYLYLIPRTYTAAEISADYLLIYATYSYPIDQTSGQFPLGNHYNTYFCYKAYYREVFDNAGNMYLFGYSPTGGKLFRLWRFNPPTSAPYGGPTVGGGFTEITPWDATHGPNGDGAAYTLQRNAVFSYGTFTTGGIIPLYQPNANCLVLIEKFFPEEMTAHSTDASLMFWSCTYVNSIQSGSATYTHFPQFVTGYMSAAWASTNLSGAAYAVYDAMEINPYLGQSDYPYNMDYTETWFLFMCNRVSGGALVTNGFCSVLVKYQFANGVAPAVMQVVDEAGWDNAYPAYKALCKYGTISSSVEQGLSAGIQPTCSWDKGIYDPTTNAFWFSGNGLYPATGTNPPFLQFSPTFSSRTVATSPLMRLTVGSGTLADALYFAPFAVGFTYKSQGQLLRVIDPEQARSPSGPTLGEKRRVHQAAILLSNTQGISFGTTFDDVLPADFRDASDNPDTWPITSLYSGVLWTTIDDNNTFDGMLCWEIDRPDPAQVVAIQGFVETKPS